MGHLMTHMSLIELLTLAVILMSFIILEVSGGKDL
jgi:hypothetical protein